MKSNKTVPHGSIFPIIIEALNGITLIDNEQNSLDDFLDFKLKNQGIRRTISHLFFSYFQHKRSIDNFLQTNLKSSSNQELYNYLAVAVTHCNFQDKVRPEVTINAYVEFSKKRFSLGISKLVNAILRKSLQTSSLHEVKFPDFFKANLIKNHGEKISDELEKIYGITVDFTFRSQYNYELNSDELQELNAEKIELENNYFNWYKSANPKKVLTSELLEKGKIYIQDIATSSSINLLDNKQNYHSYLDLCGAPGGKAIMCSEIFNNQLDLTILDRSEKRQELTKMNLDTRNLSAKILIADARNFQDKNKFDIVFADVPCSNSGVFRKRPDAIWRLSHKSLTDIVDIQLSILNNATKLVSKSGIIIYSTCSIENAENENLIRNFLSKNEQFELIREQLTLPSLMNDGSYTAIIALKK